MLKIPTGDGMALVLYKSPEEPVECALEISRALKEHPELRLPMGAHSGPISGVVDVNERTNVAGAGINVAQRIMDCGDAGLFELEDTAPHNLTVDLYVDAIGAHSERTRAQIVYVLAATNSEV